MGEAKAKANGAKEVNPTLQLQDHLLRGHLRQSQPLRLRILEEARERVDAEKKLSQTPQARLHRLQRAPLTSKEVKENGTEERVARDQRISRLIRQQVFLQRSHLAQRENWAVDAARERASKTNRR